jgi:isocitrate dehydrogenase
LKYRGEFDGNQALIDFANTLEAVCIETVEAGHMTKDLALLVGPDQKYLTTQEYMDKVAKNLKQKLG